MSVGGEFIKLFSSPWATAEHTVEAYVGLGERNWLGELGALEAVACLHSVCLRTSCNRELAD